MNHPIHNPSRHPLHRPLSLALGATAALLLGGCGAMHGHHGAMQAPATPGVQATASTATLTSGYAKVAAPANAQLYFINLKNGDVLGNPVRVQFGLSGMGVAPAGMEKANTGHHHLLVDVAHVDVNAPLPADAQHRHFGAGQTEAQFDLPPGTHTLQLLLADHNHIPHHPVVMSERITITVR